MTMHDAEEDRLQTSSEVAGWPVRITSYRRMGEWCCEVSNLAHGDPIALASGQSRQMAVSKAESAAEERLARRHIFAH